MRMLTDHEATILLSAGGAAPSMHNTQPWWFVTDGTAVDVLLDADRTLPAEDPTGRLVLIGLGAAAFNLRVAAAMLGYETTLVTALDRAALAGAAAVDRGDGGDDGVPDQALGPRPAALAAAFRDLAVGSDRPTATFEPAPLLAVLATESDGSDDWFSAGHALERGLLTAFVV